MIQGLITTKDVLLKGPAIVSGFGIVVYLRCLRALIKGRTTTFLALVFE
jgi:hypothetical protein